jgi:hypothetical protein
VAQQLGHARQRLWIGVQPAVDLARSAIDLLCACVIDRPACRFGNQSSQPLAVRADQPGDSRAICRYAELLEGAQPGSDARLDSVDERSVEIEDESARLRKILAYGSPSDTASP